MKDRLSALPQKPEWEVASEPNGALQFLQQTEGWDKSYRHIKDVVASQGPFDGILGFSQVRASSEIRIQCPISLS